MRRILKWLLIAAVVLVVIGAIQVFRRMEQLGQFITLEKVVPGQCRTIAAPPGPEDLVIDRTNAILFVSSDDRRAGDTGAGGIYRLDPRQIDQPAVLLTGEGSGTPSPFHPHGISLYTGPDGSRTLMVVNHRSAGMDNIQSDAHAIEIFDVTGTGASTALRHRSTITSSVITSPNDVLAISADSFYVTNHLGSETAFGARLETVLGLNRANVVWFDGQSARKVAEGLGFANGIAMSPDGATVYVAETMARRLKAYHRDAATGALTLAIEGFFGTGLDNIDVAPDGALWIGSHPRMIDFVGHADDPSQRSPSQILRVEPQAGGAARTLYTDDGSEISGISAAVEFEKTIFAGAVFEPKLLVCPWTTTPEPPAP